MDTAPPYKLPLSILCPGELKRRKCLLPAFSPFPTFSKGLFHRGDKSRDFWYRISRAIQKMALDRSPESISAQNEFELIKQKL